MELVPAKAEDIAAFKKAAVARYREIGVEPEVAEILFDTKLATVAEDLGIMPADKTEKIADALAGAMGKDRVKQANILQFLAKHLGPDAIRSYAKAVGSKVTGVPAALTAGGGVTKSYLKEVPWWTKLKLHTARAGAKKPNEAVARISAGREALSRIFQAIGKGTQETVGKLTGGAVGGIRVPSPSSMPKEIASNKLRDLIYGGATVGGAGAAATAAGKGVAKAVTPKKKKKVSDGKLKEILSELF